jgi:hypothetical protein
VTHCVSERSFSFVGKIKEKQYCSVLHEYLQQEVTQSGLPTFPPFSPWAKESEAYPRSFGEGNSFEERSEDASFLTKRLVHRALMLGKPRLIVPGSLANELLQNKGAKCWW